MLVGISAAVRPETPLTVMLLRVVLLSWSIRWLGANDAVEIGVEAAGPENESALQNCVRSALSAASSSEWVTPSRADVEAPRTAGEEYGDLCELPARTWPSEAGDSFAAVGVTTAECCALGSKCCALDKLGSCCVVRVVEVAGFWGSVGDVAERAAEAASLGAGCA
jgi:hypothetical protein